MKIANDSWKHYFNIPQQTWFQYYYKQATFVSHSKKLKYSRSPFYSCFRKKSKHLICVTANLRLSWPTISLSDWETVSITDMAASRSCTVCFLFSWLFHPFYKTTVSVNLRIIALLTCAVLLSARTAVVALLYLHILFSLNSISFLTSQRWACCF